METSGEIGDGVKGIIDPKIKIVSSFTNFFFSVESQRMYFGEKCFCCSSSM